MLPSIFEPVLFSILNEMFFLVKVEFEQDINVAIPSKDAIKVFIINH